MEAIRDIVARAPHHLRAGGWLLFEHGFDQGQAARDLLRTHNFGQIATHRDLQGQERISQGRLTGQ
jgi:release factor glutamine methyltransferase